MGSRSMTPMPARPPCSSNWRNTFSDLSPARPSPRARVTLAGLGSAYQCPGPLWGVRGLGRECVCPETQRSGPACGGGVMSIRWPSSPGAAPLGTSVLGN